MKMLKQVFAISLLVVICVAEPPRYRTAATQRFQRKRILARQEAAPLSPPATGYPAAGVTPEIPFDLPTSTAKPDSTNLPPDNTYGPPSPPAAQLPGNSYGPPDNTYGPPPAPSYESTNVIDQVEPVVAEDEVPQPAPNANEEEEEIFVAVAEDGSVISISTAYDQGSAASADGEKESTLSGRLVFQRFPQGRRRQPSPVPVPARFIQMRRVAAAPAKFQLQQLQQQREHQQPQSFAYSSRIQTW